MFNIRTFMIKLGQGAATLVAGMLIPLAAHHLTRNGAVVFIAWLFQLALFAAAMIYFREKIKNWLWLIIVATAPILMAPVIGSHFNSLALALLPVKMVELTRESFPVIRPGINTVLVAKGARVYTPGEIWFTKTETYEVENRNIKGQYDTKTSATEYRFVPILWAGDMVREAFGLLEYNRQTKEDFNSKVYSYMEDDPEKLPVLYLVPGSSVLRSEAEATFRESLHRPSYELSAGFLPFANAFTSEAALRVYVRSRLMLPVIFFFLVLTGFVIIPAITIARKS
ncbi:MAG: hypothetical protein KBA61_02005 [Spirochaetes bacterium]|nr:hypothetical protein [Spirochaetota bacterium]